MTNIGQVFKPGQIVPTSGIYEVIHDQDHAQEHEVTCVKDKKFPTCSRCGEHPRFKLKHKAVHIETHKYFEHYF